MKQKRVLVTGGAGYIGSHTVVSLHRAGHIPIIVDDFSHSNPIVLKALEEIIGYEPYCFKANCRDEKALNEINKEHPIDGVIHFAAFKSVGESVEKPLKYYENNLESILSVIKFCDRNDIRPLVFSSSCTVYGQPNKLPVDEEAQIKPAESPYGRTKQICEYILEDAIASGMSLKSISLRYFNPIGAEPSGKIGELPIGRPNNLVPFITQTAAGLREKLTIFGDDYDTPDGTCIRDYIHVMDLADSHVMALAYLWGKDSSEGLIEYFNIGTGTGYSVLEVVKSFIEVNGVELNFEIGPRRAGDITKIYASTEKVNGILDWKPKRSIKEALKDAWNWQKNLSNIDLELTA